MTHTSPDAEQDLENATLVLFPELGWETVNAYHETCCSPASSLARWMCRSCPLTPGLDIT